MVSGRRSRLGNTATLPLAGLGIDLTWAEIYDGVELEFWNTAVAASSGAADRAVAARGESRSS